MKKELLLLTICFYTIVSFSQGVTSGAEGKSSVLLNGSAIGIDLSEAELSFGWNNINQLVVRKNNEWFGGFETRVKNSSGLGKLFSKGDLVPEGKLNGYCGYFISNALGSYRDSKDLGFNSGNRPGTRLDEEKRLIILKYYDSLKVILEDSSYLIKDDPGMVAELGKIEGDFATFISGGNPLVRFPGRINDGDPTASSEINKFRTQVKIALAKVFQNLVTKSFEDLTDQTFLDAKQSLSSNYYRLTFFGFGGINAIGFKRFVELNPVDLSESFEDINDRGGQVGVGINFEYRRWRIGAMYTYVSKNNFKSLTEGTYTLKNENTAGPTTLTSEEEITAYSGDFGSVEQNEFNLDLIYNLPLDQKRKSFLLLNPYIRGNWFSRSKSLLINTTNVGVGFHFFQNTGKFLGGFYVELPDINNNIEKKKPVDKQRLRPPFKRLTLGITAKFSLNSIMNW